jgi:hypothetical protein
MREFRKRWDLFQTHMRETGGLMRRLRLCLATLRYPLRLGLISMSAAEEAALENAGCATFNATIDLTA